MPLIYPSRGNRPGPAGISAVPPHPASSNQPQQTEEPAAIRPYSCPDYDRDYLVTTRVPSADSFEEDGPKFVSFLHSYAVDANKSRHDPIKRKWLDAGIYQNPDGIIYKRLLEEASTDSDYEPTEADVRQWLKIHKRRKRLVEKLQKRAKDPENESKNSKYKYKSWGVLNRSEPLILEANFDEVKDQLRVNIRPDEVEEMLMREKKMKKRFAGAHVSRGSSMASHEWGLLSSSSSDDTSSAAENSEKDTDPDGDDTTPPTPVMQEIRPLPEAAKKTARRKKEKTPTQLAAEAAAKRRKIWVELAKKDVHRAFKSNQNLRKESTHLRKKLAVGCMREVRKKALLSQKIARENVSRSKRLCREMQAFWKRYERAEKDQRKRAEKEALEQLKVDAELREAKRQQRKLNFLITQTELYAHFMSHKRTPDQLLQDQATQSILGKLDQGLDGTHDDDVDSERIKSEALGNARNAFFAHKQEKDDFDAELGMPKQEASSNGEEGKEEAKVDEEEILSQPQMFQGTLKSYQLKGMSWLYGLYDRGINGILADEMGLGKTVQTIAFLSALVERQSIWGPFLVIAPASTLHNWQQELSKFVPKFKVVPYWGNTSDRKVLRKFWSARNQDLHTEHSSFHVVVTSYQLVIQDVKYFQRIKWQYMVLDEAQAIKSTSSQRWKVLLGFSCRNRLLLTGTPIQNAMQELWGLLHFIMPYLFDSHQEFNEWFSKDIESHAENKTAIDEKHLSRLHMILKPFMLRRIKKDVENELSDKIEIRVNCPLTLRQKMMCTALRKKIRIEDLMQSTGIDGTSQASASATSCLMNIVMQFRKVCNHPDIFEREDVRSPFFMKLNPVCLPKTILESDLFIRPLRSRIRTNIWHPGEIHSLSQPLSSSKNLVFNNAFEFLSLTGLSPSEVSRCVQGSPLDLLELSNEHNLKKDLRYYWSLVGGLLPWFALRTKLPLKSELSHSSWRGLLFVVADSSKCFESTVTITPIPETPAHYEHRVRKANDHLDDEETTVRLKVEQITHRSRPSLVYSSLLHPPSFTTGCLMSPCLASPPDLTTSHNAGFRWLQRVQLCGSKEAHNWYCTGFKDVAPDNAGSSSFLTPGRRPELFGILGCRPRTGWSSIVIPSKERLVTQSGKLKALDELLKKLKAGEHRVLIYSQMTRMIDLLEEFMIHRKYIYIRLDGSSRISDRRDMVNDFQERADIFVFLLSTRAGGLGINLTAADTVIFYDSDWNPTVDQQAMDRAHRLGQTKQVMVYRLICENSIEERMLERAKEKSEIQRMVMSGTHMRPQDALKPKEVVSLLLDDEELERKFRQKQEERRLLAAQTLAVVPPSSSSPIEPPPVTTVPSEVDSLMNITTKRKRTNRSTGRPVGRPKRVKTVEDSVGDSVPASPASELSLNSTMVNSADDDRDMVLVVDEDYNQCVPSAPVKATNKTKSRAPKNKQKNESSTTNSSVQENQVNNATTVNALPGTAASGTQATKIQRSPSALSSEDDVSDPAFAWNDLNLDNLEEIDVNDIDLSTLENIKV